MEAGGEEASGGWRFDLERERDEELLGVSEVEVRKRRRSGDDDIVDVVPAGVHEVNGTGSNLPLTGLHCLAYWRSWPTRWSGGWILGHQDFS